MLRVDLERREIAAAVRDLAFPAGALPRSAGRAGALRAEMGAAAHRAYARRRELSERGFRAEVPIHLVHRVDGFTARLSGRADGIVEWESANGRHVRVEEVKSVDAAGARLTTMRPEDVPEATLQVALYALAVLRTADEPPAVTTRVVLVSVDDGREAALDVPFDAEHAARRLDALLRAKIAAARERARRARWRASLAGHVRFPYGAHRPHQQQLADAIARGLAENRPVLAEAPTGIGKTVAALVPALRAALAADAVLLYLTAKRTQRERVAATFEDVAAAAGPAGAALRALSLRPKDDMCPPGTLHCDVDECALLAGLHDAARRAGAVDALLGASAHVTPDAVFALGAREGLCPHFLSRVLCGRVDLVIGDYNHLYATTAEPGAFPCEELPRRVLVVVDEAHNLVDRAREYDSTFVARDRVAALARQSGPNAPRVATLFGEIEGAAASQGALAQLAGDVLRLVDGTVEEARRTAPPSRDGHRRVALDAAPWDALSARAAHALAVRLGESAGRGRRAGEDPVVETLDAVLRLRDLLKRDEPQLVPYAACGERRGVGVVCVDPAERLAQRHRQVAGTVLMSATLAPLAHYREALGLAALDPVEVSLPSPFPPEHRCVLVVPTVRTTWRARSGCLGAVAREIEHVVDARPGHYVAFFPSHRYLEDVRAHLRTPADAVIVQRPRTPDRERDAILTRLRRDPSPLLLLAVTGGVFAEGVDLPGAALIGAIVVGPSLPTIGFERDEMRRYHDARGHDGFARALLHPGMQRVVQAAGRVHRTAEDRGVIVLLGERFVQPAYAACLPAAWRAADGRVPAVRDTTGSLRTFWARPDIAASPSTARCEASERRTLPATARDGAGASAPAPTSP